MKKHTNKQVKNNEAQAMFRPGTKRAAAAKVFNKYVSKGRQHVLLRFQRDVGLTPAGASTYFQSLRRASEG